MTFIITTSWDDGAKEDERLSELLQKYDLPATFYIPIENPERDVLSEQKISDISENFDIGGHTYSHCKLTEKSHQEAFKEVKTGKERLEEITGQNVDSFCYPWGEYNRDSINAVREAGFEGSRTVKQLSIQEKNPYKLGTTVHAGGNPFNHIKNSKNLNLRNRLIFSSLHASINGDWLDLAVKSLKRAKKNEGVFHLWGHSWEIEELGIWDQLEELFEKMSEIEEARYINNSELMEEIANES